MESHRTHLGLSQTKGGSVFEVFLLAVCLCVVAIRATYTEVINLSSSNSWLNLDDNLVSLIFSSVLFLCALLWLIRAVFKKQFIYRCTGLVWPLMLFIVAGLIATFFAANKRAAINEFVTLVAPVIMAMLLVQILDSGTKIRLVLVVVVGLGIASAYQCASQFFVDAEMMIEQYEAKPETLLEPLGIQLGSFQQMLFEHRLYTKGIAGFLLTSNSVASFSILAAFAAIALLLEQIAHSKTSKRTRPAIILSSVALVLVLLNFGFSRSKGGIGAAVFALVVFGLLVRFGDFIRAHRKKIVIFCVLAVIGFVWLVVSYGREHGELPGGKSMLVRWQYWAGAARMFAGHPFTGVGPGNFSSFYTQYKAPGALEVVRDPHDFVLSVLTQYGPLGLVGFLALLFMPLWHNLERRSETNLHNHNKASSLSKRLIVLYAVIISVVLLTIRPIVKPFSGGDEQALVVAYVVSVLYIVPVLAFAVGFWISWSGSKVSGGRFGNVTAAALFCACIGVAVHNLIDFAIFESGIYTTVWVILACIICLNRDKDGSDDLLFAPKRFVKVAVVILAAVAGLGFCRYALIPVAGSTQMMHRARRAYESGLLDECQIDIKEAARRDSLDPVPLYMSANLYLQYPDYYSAHREQVLLLAEKSFRSASERNPADFKPHERLAELYDSIAQTSPDAQKTRWLQKAFDSALAAVELYPGLARLRMKLAQVAEELGKSDVALANYSRAVEIEDAYRVQFRKMYPGREVFSRLGEEKYTLAKRKVEQLTELLR